MKWYNDKTLFDYLETTKTKIQSSDSFVLPVQSVNRPNLNFRGYSGTIAEGKIRKGDELISLPSNQKVKVKDIFVGERSLKTANLKQSITLTIDKEIDTSRGDILCSKNSTVDMADQFNMNVIWMSEDKGFTGRTYLAKIHNISTSIKIMNIKKIYDVNTLEFTAGNELKLNDVAEISISFNKTVPFSTFKENKILGSLIIIDPINNQTIGMGMINFSLRRSQNIQLQNLTINKNLREKINGHKGQVLWMTGLSGSGKSTIANELEKILYSQGKKTYILDGDNIRHGLNKDLGFTDKDRVENIRRVAEVAKLMCDAGLIVITAFISPFRLEREMARSLFEKNDFKEIYISTPLKVAEKRDPKGLYKKARQGKIPNFTGIDSIYEKPTNPELEIDTSKVSLSKAVKKILNIIT